VGFVAGHRTRRFDCDGEVQWIDVDQQQRGRGIGYKLMAQIGSWFVMQHAKRICVNVDANNLAARKLYDHCGARPLNEGWMVWDHSSLICRP
jgi:GNAT superfamily N-acetyltransferase